ncbi:MAG: hypothetical protein Q4B63_03760 [Clostridium perfringens]|nr:hypothetical protein [Clostridium perfringens]
MSCDNKKACTCTFQGCSRHRKCCKCIAHHCDHEGGVPGSLFSKEGEALWKRYLDTF